MSITIDLNPANDFQRQLSRCAKAPIGSSHWRLFGRGRGLIRCRRGYEACRHPRLTRMKTTIRISDSGGAQVVLNEVDLDFLVGPTVILASRRDVSNDGLVVAPNTVGTFGPFFDPGPISR